MPVYTETVRESAMEAAAPVLAAFDTLPERAGTRAQLVDALPAGTDVDGAVDALLALGKLRVVPEVHVVAGGHVQAIYEVTA